ncbi:MAG TPA: DNA mismatch repair endonuclease MutL [Terriglobia bacterium]|nr:DNA mismatch repair endonuclease MutL [Terriglobia bacterium]
MSVIHILPEAVANQIAAGEVVERPASVVKELMENSLDAGAARVEIAVEAGGKRLIRILDDGCGMSHDDTLLAFERHATSKIRIAEDLFEIATLGFRGEALPSIAAVSRLALETRHASEPAGTRIEFAGGKLRDVSEVARPSGTMIVVRDLFYNTPARRKFLKSESTELGHIATLSTHYALAHPDKSFRLGSFSHEVLNVSPVASSRERIYQVMGGQLLEQLVEIAPRERPMLPPALPVYGSESDGVPAAEPAAPSMVRVSGFVSRPEVEKLNRNSIYFFVNRRLVRDRLILHAVSEAYRNILPSGVFPVSLIFLELPAAEVDVNVHPSKTEVRFRHSAFIHDFVRDSIRQALMAARPVAAFPFPKGARAAKLEDDAEVREQLGEEPLLPERAPAPRGLGADRGMSPAGLPDEVRAAALAPPGGALQGPGDPAPARHAPDEPARTGATAATGFHLSAPEPVPQTGNLPLSDAAPALHAPPPAFGTSPGFVENVQPVDEFPRNLRPLGQVEQSFIVATNAEGLWIIDQHVAHERVLFERHQRQRREKKVEAQRLLLPIVVELKPGQQAAFQDIAEELTANGFDVEPFGQRTVAIKTAPADIRADDVERLLIEILDGVGPEARAVSLDERRAKIAASVACHAAIKVNMPLETGKMTWLLRELAATECPMTCPHGRPIVLRYSLREIQKAFKRL